MSPIRRGRSTSRYKIRLWSDKMRKKYSACKPLLLKTFSCIVTPCLSSGYKEIFIKREKKVDIFFLVPYWGWREGGGHSLGDMSPKKSSFFIDALPKNILDLLDFTLNTYYFFPVWILGKYKEVFCLQSRRTVVSKETFSKEKKKIIFRNYLLLCCKTRSYME